MLLKLYFYLSHHWIWWLYFNLAFFCYSLVFFIMLKCLPEWNSLQIFLFPSLWINLSLHPLAFFTCFKKPYNFQPSLIMIPFLFLAFWFQTGAAQMTFCEWMINLFHNFFSLSRIVQTQHGFLPNVCKDISVYVYLVNSVEASFLSINFPGVQY